MALALSIGKCQMATPESFRMSFDRPADHAIPPSDWVCRFAKLVPEGAPVLDVACGHGRHARLFLDLGHPVTAVDVDISGLGDLGDNARATVLKADLEADANWPFSPEAFGGIIVTNYMHRPHFPLLAETLSPGGVLIFETFGVGNEKLGRPRNPDFLLAPGELLRAFQDRLQIVAYEHGEERTPRPAIRQRLAAVNATGPVLLP